jgi:prepilin-type N-terminal cleavage/methylation domain-containing protein
MTLLEVLVTLVILGAMSSVATLAARRSRSTVVDRRTMLDDSLRVAIADGRSITIVVEEQGRRIAATVEPDGQVVADSGFVPRREGDAR